MAQMASHTNLKVSVSSTFSLVFSAAKVDIKLPKHSKMLFSRSGLKKKNKQEGIRLSVAPQIHNR
jgi:hypothetical protein